MIKIDKHTLDILTGHEAKYGEFVSRQFPFANLMGTFIDMLEADLRDQGMRLAQSKKSIFDSSIRHHHYEVQWHDFSVLPHCDDVAKGIFFAIIPFATATRSTGTSYVSMPLFNFVGLDNKKQESALHAEEWQNDILTNVIVFNPRKKHSLTYIGVEVKLMLFAVEKIKTK